jgi:N-acyl-D-amino-acid deacylase
MRLGVVRVSYLLVILCISFFTSLESLLAEAPYDLVIRNGKVVDGTGNPWFLADVGIKNDRITAIGRIPAGLATREIDATGHVVAPGFIDVHSHSDTLVLEDGTAQSKIRQGVTTEILGEGDSVAPASGKAAAQKIAVRGKTLQWRTLGEYFETLEKSKVSVNIGSYVGLGSVWRCVMGESFDRPTTENIKEMRDLLRQALDEGAFGMSSMLAMPPGSLATKEEIIELCAEVAKSGGIYSSHIRNEGLGVLDGVKEAIEIGERAGIPVDIIHLKIADQKYWGHMPEIVALIEAARARGVNVQANVYPYTRGNNDLASIIPPWAHEGGTAKLLERVKDPLQRAKIKHDIREGLPGWYNHYTAVGGDWSRMLISKETTFKGLTMDRVLAARAKDKSPAPDLLDEFLDYLVLEQGRVSTVYAHHTEEDMNLALVQPWCSIGSDGAAYATEGLLRRGNPHPRSFGTFPRVLGVYVRELKLLRLEDAIRKMTSLNAAKVGIHDRGLLRPAQFADIVVFDPQRVIDRATYTEPFEYSLGIQYVIVNGQLVLDNGTHTGALPGRPLRKANGTESAHQSGK